jgi:predicted CoA-binding protein
MTSRASIDAFIAEPALALFGLSRSGGKFGNLAWRELTKHGYRVYPVHPEAPAIAGTTCYPSLAGLPEPVNAALVVVPPAKALDVIEAIARAGIEHVWLQQGAESPEALARARELGLDVVAGECILMYARPHGIHRAHAWIWRVLGKTPGRMLSAEG